MSDPKWEVIHGDCLDVMRAMPDTSVDCCVTSPPYWGLRDYGVAGQLGLESTPAEYVARMVEVFREVRRVLKDDGTLWLNLGDSYAAGGNGTSPRYVEMRGEKTAAAQALPRKVAPDGLKPKDLVGIPWRVAFALQADGWYLRSDIIWSKPNPMPESVTDRPTKAHEYLFLLSKSSAYHYDAAAIAEDASTLPGERDGASSRIFTDEGTPRSRKPNGSRRLAERQHERTGGLIGGGVEHSSLGVPATAKRNRRTVWSIQPEPFPGAHFAVMPTALVKPCVLAGCRPGGTVLDPFTGSGTVGYVALENGCGFVGVELNPAYVEIARERIGAVAAAPLLDFGAP